MAHLQYMPGDPRLVDQLVYELKSKGIFDQFRKECIADVDTRPAYQNLRQRVESSVSTFLSRQTWKPDLNKNQLREKLRKHILDGNYLEQGVERIVDQVVNPKVASVFVPQVEDLVYNYLGIPRKKTPKAEVAEKSPEDLLPTDLEAVSPISVKSNDGESKESDGKVQDMDIDSEEKNETIEEMSIDKVDLVEVSSDSASIDKSSIPLPTEEIKLENIPAPENSPKPAKIELENIELPSEPTIPAKIEIKNIELPKEPNLSTDIPLPDEICLPKENNYLNPVDLQSEDSNSSSSSSIRRNMSPLTPVRNFDDENSCDAQQAFENNSIENDHKEPNSFRFNIEAKDSTNDSSDVKIEKKQTEQLAHEFANQVNINTFNTPLYDDSSNSHNLQIDYESDANTNTSKTIEVKPEVENSEDSKKEKKDDKKSHKSSSRSRDSSRHSSSKDKHSNSKDSSRQDKKSSSKDDKSKSSKERERSKDRSDKKDSSKHKSSHKSSSSSKDKDRSSSSSHRHSSKSSDDRKSSSKEKGSEKDVEKSSEKDKTSRDRKDSKSSSNRDKDRKSSKKDKDKKKDKKDTDDHYSSSGRGNHSRRSTDRDSNDGSSSSKGSQSQNNSKSTTDSKKENKSSSSKSDNTSTSGESTSPSDKEHSAGGVGNMMQFKPIVRVDNHLETPIANPPRLPFVPDVTLKKPKFANNFEEAKRMMKMRKFLADEQKRMNQEAALLLEFQANVRPSLSQVYSSISGPELEFACVTHTEPDVPPIKKKVHKKSAKAEDFTKIKICDTKVLETITTCELLETNQVTKDIINDIIGVPVSEGATGQNSDIIIETDAVEIPSIYLKNGKSKNNDSYYENKQFSQIVNEISEYKVSDKTIDPLEESIAEIVNQNMCTELEITVAAETLSEADVSEILETKEEPKLSEKELQYFAEHEKFNAELEKLKFGDFLQNYIETNNVSNRMYLMNCDTYEENIVKEMASKLGDFEILSFFPNGHVVPNKNIVKDVPLCTEISLPVDLNYKDKSPLFSPVKSECSFELSSDYDAKLDESVNKKSRQEVMEIILGGIIDESPSKMPTIDYYTEVSDTENTLTIVEDICTESNLDENIIKAEKEVIESSSKRKADEDIVNDSRSVLTPIKIRKISDSDQISSTTEDTEVSNNNKVQSAPRSKYLSRARRVGLPRPKRCSHPNSPSSDKSVENYAQNTPTSPNGKLKTPRSKVQRYDTADLYKPKLHYLSRRNNIR